MMKHDVSDLAKPGARFPDLTGTVFARLEVTWTSKIAIGYKISPLEKQNPLWQVAFPSKIENS